MNNLKDIGLLFFASAFVCLFALVTSANLLLADSMQILDSSHTNKRMIVPLYDRIKQTRALVRSKFVEAKSAAEEQEDEEEENPEEFGASISVLPDLGPVVWRASSKFLYQAYVYKTPKNKKVAFIRLPNYNDADVFGFMTYEFGRLMNIFEDKADALIIDQQSNPGGNFLYLYALCSMLSQKTLELPKERMAITQEHVYSAITDLEWIQLVLDKMNAEGSNEVTVVNTPFGYIWTLKDILNLQQNLRDIVKQWNEGKNFTDPMHLLGISEIHSNAQFRFTKPIIILVNHLNFACGETFPAIMQDNKRATIMGSKTAGASGLVESHSHPNLFGIQEYTFTVSHTVRSNKKPIANLGVTPDIPYTLTANDLQNDYEDYVKAINAAVEKLIK